MSSDEQWRPLAYNGRNLAIGSHGHVWRLPFIGSDGRRLKGIELRQSLACSCRYMRVRVGDRHELVHRLVAMAFIGPIGTGLEVCHLDNNRENNRAENLRIGTRSSNHVDRVLSGAQHTLKLKPSEVLEIRASDARSRDLAARYGVKPGTIRAIRNGRIWGWLGDNGERLDLENEGYKHE